MAPAPLQSLRRMVFGKAWYESFSAPLQIGESSMSLRKASGLALFAAVCLLGETASSTHAQCVSSFENISCATEWSGGSVINLGGLPGASESQAFSINDAGRAVGLSLVGGVSYATEWSGGSIINLGGLPGSTNSIAKGINGAGQAVGVSLIGGGDQAVEWSGGSVISLGGFPNSQALSINDAGKVVGVSVFTPSSVPESSAWSMMLVGFAGLALAGYRRAKAGRATLTRRTLAGR
jgi:uncharacterized membrane protein